MRFVQRSGGDHGPPRLRLWATLVVALALTMLTQTRARADSVELTLVNVGPQVAGFYTWTYAVELTPGNRVRDTGVGDVIGIYDIGGYKAGSAQFIDAALAPPGVVNGTYNRIADTDAALGYAPGGVAFVTGAPPPFPPLGGSAADLALADLYFDYVGTTFQNVSGSSILLGLITLQSQFNTGAFDVAFTTDSSLTGPNVGRWQELTVARQGGFTIVPTPVASMGGLALFGLVGGLRKRR